MPSFVGSGVQIFLEKCGDFPYDPAEYFVFTPSPRHQYSLSPNSDFQSVGVLSACGLLQV